MILNGYRISKAYFKTKKKHTNKPNDIELINASVIKGSGGRTEIYLDSSLIGTVQYSNKSKIIKEEDSVSIELYIETPKNIELLKPFAHQMKLYPLFGKTFKIENGSANNKVYKK